MVHNKETKFNTALNMSSASINMEDENEDQSTLRNVEQTENDDATFTGEISEDFGSNLMDISTDSSLIQKQKELEAESESPRKGCL